MAKAMQCLATIGEAQQSKGAAKHGGAKHSKNLAAGFGLWAGRRE